MTVLQREPLYCSECDQDINVCYNCNKPFEAGDEAYDNEEGDHCCEKCNEEFNK